MIRDAAFYLHRRKSKECKRFHRGKFRSKVKFYYGRRECFDGYRAYIRSTCLKCKIRWFMLNNFSNSTTVDEMKAFFNFVGEVSE